MCVFVKGGLVEVCNYWVKIMQGIIKYVYVICCINEGMFDLQMVEDFIGLFDFDEYLFDDSFYLQEVC